MTQALHEGAFGEYEVADLGFPQDHAPTFTLHHVYAVRGISAGGQASVTGVGFICGHKLITGARLIKQAHRVDVLSLDGEVQCRLPYAHHVDIENDIAVLPLPHRPPRGISISSLAMAGVRPLWALTFNDQTRPVLVEVSVSGVSGSANQEVVALEDEHVLPGPVFSSAGDLVGVALGAKGGRAGSRSFLPSERLPRGFAEAYDFVCFGGRPLFT